MLAPKPCRSSPKARTHTLADRDNITRAPLGHAARAAARVGGPPRGLCAVPTLSHSAAQGREHPSRYMTLHRVPGGYT